MFNEFLTRNRMSTLSNASCHRSNKSSSNHDNPIRFDQPVGHQFASNILVADLAIRSTAYNNNTTSSSSPPPIIKTDVSVKARRCVTFNLDDIQIQTIPAYDSTSEISSSSEISLAEEEEDDTITNTSTMMMMSNKEQQQTEVIQEPPPPPAPPISQPSTSERISKKASYDALQKRKQFRRDQQQPTTKPGYWYPLASPRTSNMIRQPLPSIRSLEMTEKLINESIQREMALNPNLHFTPPSPSPSPHSDINDDDAEEEEAEEESTPITMYNIDNSEPNTVSMLITDTDDEEEEEDVEYDEPPTTMTTTTTATNTVSSSDEEESTSTSSLPLPTILNGYGQEKEEIETDFTESVYNELAKRHNQQVLPIPEYQLPRLTFPFEQNLVPISANKDVLIISPPPSPPPIRMHNLDEDDDPIWTDHPSLLINNRLSQHQHERRGLFFVKVLKAESLDFPIENDNTNTFCSIKYKGIESRSRKQVMTHTMKIEHELRIEDVDSDEQIAITIHVDENSNKKANNWYNRIRSSSDLERYVHEKDGSICQTLFSPSRFVVDGSLDQTATLMLVNNWYRTNNELSLTSTSSSSLLLKRSSLMMKKKKMSPVVMREKAVGKIYIQCLYVTTSKKCDYLPQTMDEAIEALNAKRFHQTDWQSGYLSQLGRNTKCLKRRYFTLTGGSLFAYRSLEQKIPLYKIPLSRAMKLVCDGYTVAERPLHLDDRTSPATLLNQLDSVIMVHQEEQEEQEDASIVDKNEQQSLLNGFQLVFDNGEKIQFSCESLEERNKWIAVLEVMICKLPKLPDWIIS